MSQIDQAIRRAMSPEDQRLLDELGREESLFVQAVNAFQGRNRLIGVLGWLGGFLLFGVFLWLAVRFVQADDPRDMLRWGAAAGLAVVGFSMIKLWFFMEMQKNVVLREVKRLELQVASLRVEMAAG